MAWQRLLRVGFYAVALTSVAPVLVAHGGATNENELPTLDVNSMPGTRLVSTKPATFLRSRERRVGQVGYASWYGGERHGKTTASGSRFDKNDLTAAHRTLPLYSKVRVTNMTNGRSVTVRITDRGPSRRGRIIDLSQSAAEQLGMRNIGVARVQVEPLVAGNFQ